MAWRWRMGLGLGLRGYSRRGLRSVRADNKLRLRTRSISCKLQIVRRMRNVPMRCRHKRRQHVAAGAAAIAHRKKICGSMRWSNFKNKKSNESSQKYCSDLLNPLIKSTKPWNFHCTACIFSSAQKRAEQEQYQRQQLLMCCQQNSC